MLIGTPQEDNLSKFMQYLNGNFAKAYNLKHGRTGRFWGERFHSTIIESETQFFYTILYVEANMLRARAVSKIEDWKFSSYHAHAYGKSDPIVNFSEYYLSLGNTPQKRQESYREGRIYLFGGDAKIFSGGRFAYGSMWAFLDNFSCGLMQNYAKKAKLFV